jgi:phosphoribosyl 1,2-cyclic phosphate phosphodiesterase
MQRSIPCWGIPRTLSGIKTTFSYVFEPDPDYDSGSLAKLDLIAINETELLTIKNFSIQTIPVMHGTLPVSAFRFGKVAYVTDCNQVSDASKAMLRNLDYLFLDALRDAPHPTHFTIAEAITLAEELSPRQTFLIHMSHNVDYTELSRRLPANIAPGYDGLQIQWELPE